MTSLSDRNKQNNGASEDWSPLDPDSLQHIDDEKFLRIKKDQPDYSIFKRIYEDTDSTGHNNSFKPFYEPELDSDMSYGDKSSEFKELFDDGNQGEKKSFFRRDEKVTDDLSVENYENAENKPHTSGKKSGNGGLMDGGSSDDMSRDRLSGISDEKLSDSMQSDPGFKDGFESGRKQGYEAGFKEGFDKGRDQGFTEGKAKGEEQGYAEGYEKGETEAKRNCDIKAGEILSSLEDILSKIDNAWTELVGKYEKELVSLVCKIAEKVVFAKVKTDDRLVKQSILNALETMPEPEDIHLYVSPEDYEYIEMVKEDFFDKIKGLTGVSLVSDPSVNRGGCRIESSKAKINTDIESRLESVFSAIAKAGTL